MSSPSKRMPKKREIWYVKDLWMDKTEFGPCTKAESRPRHLNKHDGFACVPYPDLVGVMGASPVVVEVKSPAEIATWREYDDVNGITPTGRRFMPLGFASWRETLFDKAGEIAPRGQKGLVRAYAVAPTSQLLRYALDYPDLSAKYSEWDGLSLPQVKHPRDVIALLVVPKENASSADISMRLIGELKYANAEVLTEDARLRVYRIRCTAFSG